MVDSRKTFAALAMAALVGCGGRGAGDQQDGAPDDGGAAEGGRVDRAPQSDAPILGLAGTLALNHAAIPDGVKGWVLVFDQAPAQGTSPVALVEVGASGAWAFPTLAAGSYYLLGAVDVNRSGELDSPGTALADPFVVQGPTDAPAAGIAIDVLTVRALVGSVRAPGVGGDETRLMLLYANVLDPTNAATLTTATVSASDGTSQFPLVWNAAQTAYVPAAPLTAAAVDGLYTFTVSHVTAYPTPFDVAVAHHPLTTRPAITAPADQHHFGAVQDVQVTWQRAATTTDSTVEVYEGGTRVYQVESAASPFTIPAAAAGFTAGHTYRIGIIDARYGGNTNLISIEAGAAEISVSF